MYYCFSGFMNEEILAQIEGWDKYMISSHGRVFAKKTQKFVKGKNTNGYMMMTFTRDGKRHYEYIHRIVGKTFIPNPENLPEINHKNGIKNDNRVENLEWATKSYNIQHAYDTKLHSNPCGEQRANAKLTELEVRCIKRLLASGKASLGQCAIMFDTDKSQIAGIKMGRTWKHVVV